MRELRILAALAPLAFVVATPALADNPNDPDMATRAARERDRAIIRKLNQDQLAYVRQRDARYAQGWEDYRRANGGSTRTRNDDYDSAQRDYARQRRHYEQAMAEWREDVAACRAGYYEHCQR